MMLYGQDLFIDLAEKPRKKSVQIERGSYFVACSGERMSKIQICFCDVHLLSLKTIKMEIVCSITLEKDVSLFIGK